MSAEKLLFNFSRDLPAPFNVLASKKVGVSSMYAAGATEATLNATVLKAALAYCKCKDGSGLGAVGQTDKKIAAEYKSSISADAYHLVVYDPSNGNIMASIYNKNTETMSQYTLHKDKMECSAVMMAMMPELLADKEFKETFDKFYKEYESGFKDMTQSADYAGLLCDNAYRRIKDTACPAHIKAEIDGSGNLTRISTTHLDSKAFLPTAVHAGEFGIFTSTPAAETYTPGETPNHGDFAGKYMLNPLRVLTPAEQRLVPVLKQSYILPPQIADICNHAKQSTGKQTQMRNFMLRGPAGTGKTEGARAVAAGLGLPCMKYTCSANTEVFDFIGQVFPETDSGSTGDAVLDAERKKLKEMGGMTYENVSKLMNLPSLDDMDYDSAGVYQALTGIEKPDASSQDCIALVLNMVTDKIQKLSRIAEGAQNSGQTYTYIETDFVKALKNGYVIEIQEPSTIMQPGVLVGLNSLLEQEGSITLPTGDIITRHPDAVVIITTNTEYEGCRGMNQSVLDRMSMTVDINLPPPEVMVQRAMSVTGADDETMVSQMVKVVNDTADFCRKNGITDGSAGMRSLIDWIVSTEITGNPYESALNTVVSKAASSEEDRIAIIASVLEPVFAPKRHKKAV